MGRYGAMMTAHLDTVVRQAAESGILTNATIVRRLIEAGRIETPKLTLKGFDDVERVGGGELVEVLGDAVGRYGLDDVVVLCRSNKRANRYNAGIRASVLYREERLSKGDKLMVVKNCYQFLENIPDLDFIANGDVAQLVRISHFEERYGLNFAEAVLSFPDYNDVEVTAKIVLDTLSSEQPSLSAEQQRALYEGVNADYSDVRGARKRYQKVREDPYYNALQIKFAYAVTCHKAQGGQWDTIYLDQGWMPPETVGDIGYYRWLYTAFTRATRKIFLVNWRKEELSAEGAMDN